MSPRVHFSDIVQIRIIEPSEVDGERMEDEDEDLDEEEDEEEKAVEEELDEDLDEEELNGYIRIRSQDDVDDENGGVEGGGGDQDDDVEMTDPSDAVDQDASMPGCQLPTRNPTADPTTTAATTSQLDPLKTRKHTILYKTPPSVQLAMESWVSSTTSTLPANLAPTTCHLHPTAPHLTLTHTISRLFTWRHSVTNTPQHLSLQLGTVMLLLAGLLTDEMKRGMVEESWHLSHLCGNWTCCNWRHFTVERGGVNVGRNGCFRGWGRDGWGGCGHKPRCLGELKVQAWELVPRLFGEEEVVEEEVVEGFGGEVGVEAVVDGGEPEGDGEFPPSFFELDGA